MKALITGANGFTGQYLCKTLAEAGYEVHGLVHDSCDLHYMSKSYQVELGDFIRLKEVVSEVQPDVVAHLAAISFVAHGNVDEIYQTNVLGTRNLLEALVGSNCRSVLLASSANVYGNATGGVLSEATLPSPANDYAVSKLAMEFIAKLYADRLPLIIARPFNYTGVCQSDSFLLPKIINRVRQKERVIELGNLDVERDFSDVRMVAQYYRRLLECSSAIGNTFNVCSGIAYSLRDVLNMVRDISGHDFDVQVNPAFVRANEVKTLLGSNHRLISTVGEIEQIPLRDTLRWMLES